MKKSILCIKLKVNFKAEKPTKSSGKNNNIYDNIDGFIILTVKNNLQQYLRHASESYLK